MSKYSFRKLFTMAVVATAPALNACDKEPVDPNAAKIKTLTIQRDKAAQEVRDAVAPAKKGIENWFNEKISDAVRALKTTHPTNIADSSAIFVKTVDLAWEQAGYPLPINHDPMTTLRSKAVAHLDIIAELKQYQK